MNTFSHVLGIQVSMETMKAASSTYQRTRMIRSIWGARTVAVVGGAGGSIEAMRILGVLQLAQPGDDQEGRHQDDEGQGRRGWPTTSTLLGRQVALDSTVSATPMRMPTTAAMGMERRTAQAAAAKAATTRVA